MTLRIDENIRKLLYMPPINEQTHLSSAFQISTVQSNVKQNSPNGCAQTAEYTTLFPLPSEAFRTKQQEKLETSRRSCKLVKSGTQFRVPIEFTVKTAFEKICIPLQEIANKAHSRFKTRPVDGKIHVSGLPYKVDLTQSGSVHKHPGPRPIITKVHHSQNSINKMANVAPTNDKNSLEVNHLLLTTIGTIEQHPGPMNTPNLSANNQSSSSSSSGNTTQVNRSGLDSSGRVIDIATFIGATSRSIPTQGTTADQTRVGGPVLSLTTSSNHPETHSAQIIESNNLTKKVINVEFSCQSFVTMYPQLANAFVVAASIEEVNNAVRNIFSKLISLANQQDNDAIAGLFTRAATLDWLLKHTGELVPYVTGPESPEWIETVGEGLDSVKTSSSQKRYMQTLVYNALHSLTKLSSLALACHVAALDIGYDSVPRAIVKLFPIMYSVDRSQDIGLKVALEKWFKPTNLDMLVVSSVDQEGGSFTASDSSGEDKIDVTKVDSKQDKSVCREKTKNIPKVTGSQTKLSLADEFEVVDDALHSNPALSKGIPDLQAFYHSTIAALAPQVVDLEVCEQAEVKVTSSVTKLSKKTKNINRTIDLKSIGKSLTELFCIDTALGQIHGDTAKSEYKSIISRCREKNVNIFSFLTSDEVADWEDCSESIPHVAAETTHRTGLLARYVTDKELTRQYNRRTLQAAGDLVSNAKLKKKMQKDNHTEEANLVKLLEVNDKRKKNVIAFRDRIARKIAKLDELKLYLWMSSMQKERRINMYLLFPDNQNVKTCEMLIEQGKFSACIGFRKMATRLYETGVIEGWVRDLTREGIESNPGPKGDAPMDNEVATRTAIANYFTVTTPGDTWSLSKFDTTKVGTANTVNNEPIVNMRSSFQLTSVNAQQQLPAVDLPRNAIHYFPAILAGVANPLPYRILSELVVPKNWKVATKATALIDKYVSDVVRIPPRAETLYPNGYLMTDLIIRANVRESRGVSFVSILVKWMCYYQQTIMRQAVAQAQPIFYMNNQISRFNQVAVATPVPLATITAHQPGVPFRPNVANSIFVVPQVAGSLRIVTALTNVVGQLVAVPDTIYSSSNPNKFLGLYLALIAPWSANTFGFTINNTAAAANTFVPISGLHHICGPTQISVYIKRTTVGPYNSAIVVDHVALMSFRPTMGPNAVAPYAANVALDPVTATIDAQYNFSAYINSWTQAATKSDWLELLTLLNMALPLSNDYNYAQEVFATLANAFTGFTHMLGGSAAATDLRANKLDLFDARGYKYRTTPNFSAIGDQTPDGFIFSSDYNTLADLIMGLKVVDRLGVVNSPLHIPQSHEWIRAYEDLAVANSAAYAVFNHTFNIDAPLIQSIMGGPPVPAARIMVYEKICPTVIENTYDSLIIASGSSMFEAIYENLLAVKPNLMLNVTPMFCYYGAKAYSSPYKTFTAAGVTAHVDLGVLCMISDYDFNATIEKDRAPKGFCPIPNLVGTDTYPFVRDADTEIRYIVGTITVPCAQYPITDFTNYNDSTAFTVIDNDQFNIRCLAYTDVVVQARDNAGVVSVNNLRMFPIQCSVVENGVTLFNHTFNNYMLSNTFWCPKLSAADNLLFYGATAITEALMRVYLLGLDKFIYRYFLFRPHHQRMYLNDARGTGITEKDKKVLAMLSRTPTSSTTAQQQSN